MALMEPGVHVPEKKQPVEIRMLEKGLSILDFVAESEQPIDRRSIQKGLGLSRSAVIRIVDTLIASGYLKETGEAHYLSLSPSLLRFRASYLARFKMELAAKPRISALAELTGTSVDIGVRVDLDMVLIQRVLTRQTSYVSPFDVGSRLPLVSTATGRAYLAVLPQYERDTLIDRWIDKCEKGVQKVRELTEQSLARFRETGYVFTVGALTPWLAAVAAPLLGPDERYYVVTCVGETEQFTEARIADTVGPALRDCVRAIASDIGGEFFVPALART